MDRSVVLGVDLKSGTAGYSTPTLLSIGTGQAPYKLDYGLSYKAAPTGCNTFGPCTGPIQGGWNQSWDVRFNTSGSGMGAMGASSPYAAAGTLVAFLAMQDIFGQSSLANLNQDVYATLAADWWRQQMLSNTATLSRGFTGEQYVRLVDGSWMAPVGSPGVLTQTGARTKMRFSCHTHGEGYHVSTSRNWVNSAESFSLRNAGGDVIGFAPWVWVYEPASNDNGCARVYGFEPTTWTWPQGVTLTFTYGTQSGGVTTDYTTGVTAIASSLGRSMSFASGINTASTSGVTGGTVTVGQQASGAIADAVSSPSGGGTGAFWNFSYTPIVGRTASQRPVPYQQLYQVFDPVSSTLPALQYGYDTRGLVKTALDANGAQLPANAALAPYTWYLAPGGRGERDDPDGGAYTVYYDTDGNEVRNIDEIGRETDSTWDGRHRVLSRIFPETDQEQFTYDANDNVTSLTQVAKTASGLANLLISATYEPTWNHLASITDARGNTTTFAYYPSGNGASLMQTATRPAVGGSSPVYQFTYNAIGLPTQTVDPAGVTATHAYDGYGNLTSTTEGASGGTTPQWGTSGAGFTWGSPAKWGTAALNLTTTFTPDGWGNITATTDPLGHVSNQTFDLDRRKLLAIEPNPGTGVRTATNTIYDGNGRVIEVDKGTTNASGSTFTSLETTTTAFDPNGNKTRVSVLNGPAGSSPLTVTQTSYDPLNRVICTAERENAAVFSSLPASACAQSTGSAVGPDHITQLTYDLAGQKLVETRGVGTSIQGPYATYTYGLDGEVATILDANSNLTTNLYDGFNRLSKVEYPVTTTGANASDPTDAESYTYDANGNRLTLTKRDLTTTISFSYDVLNRMTAKTFAAPNTAANVAYSYDLAGRPMTARFNNQSGNPGVAWSYDAAGRRITEATNGRRMSFTYDAASNPATMTWPDGLSIAYGFDAANRLTSVGSTPATVSPGYDGLSRMNALTRTGGSTSAIGYDNADRMTSLAHVFSPTSGNQTWTYAFTPASQLQTTTSANTAWDWSATAASAVNTVADGLNRNATVAGVSQTYDHFGNLTSDGTRTFTYDTENRLLTESGPITMALSYDPMGQLQQSVINGTTTQFLYDGDALVGEYPATGNTPLRRYVHGPGTDNPVIWYEGGTMTASNANFLIADRQGSIVATASTAGALAVNYTYDAYGVPSTWGTVGTVPRFRYTGQAAIPEAKLYHYKARVYDPASGRFLQTDPVGYGPDVNWYAYVGNDPVNAGDPTGDAPQRCLIGGCGEGSAVAAGGSPDIAGDYEAAISNIGVAALSAMLQDYLAGAPGTAMPGGPITSQQKCERGCHGVPTAPNDRYSTKKEDTNLAIASGVLTTALTWGAGGIIDSGVLAGASFAQRTFSQTFSAGGAFAGQTVSDVAGLLRTGELTVTDVPVQFIVRDGNTLILNTRSAQALEQAGIPRNQWNAIDMTGDAAAESRLTAQLRRNGLTSRGTKTVRPTGGN